VEGRQEEGEGGVVGGGLREREGEKEREGGRGKERDTRREANMNKHTCA